MGNRGCLINKTRTIVRYDKTKNWIICKLSFGNKTLPLMEPEKNTQIFFLDEATALAAGHRPCGRCMRDRLNEFLTYWTEANPDVVGNNKPLVEDIDAHLHTKRLTTPDG